MLFGIHFGSLGKLLGGSVVVLVLERFHATIEGIVQHFVFLHRSRAFLHCLFHGGALLSRHFARLFLGKLRGSTGGGGFSALLHRLLLGLVGGKVEVDGDRI